MVFLEQLWNRDLSEYDPDGPLPDVDPIEGESTIAPGSIPARSFTGRRQATADEWRAEATAENLSIRDLMVRRAARQTFVGSAATIADQLDLHVQTHACDGFILVPHITPGRARSLRRRGRAAAAGARLVPDRVRGHDAARAPRAGTAVARSGMIQGDEYDPHELHR